MREHIEAYHVLSVRILLMRTEAESVRVRLRCCVASFRCAQKCESIKTISALIGSRVRATYQRHADGYHRLACLALALPPRTHSTTP